VAGLKHTNGKNRSKIKLVLPGKPNAAANGRRMRERSRSSASAGEFNVILRKGFLIQGKTC